MLELNEPLPQKYKIRGSNILLTTSSSSSSRLYKIKYNRIKYNYGVNRQGIIDYIDTVDPKFKTQEGFSLSTTLREILDKTGFELIKEVGWAYYIKLKLGWNAAFIVGRTCTEKFPNDNDKVKFFFKRK